MSGFAKVYATLWDGTLASSWEAVAVWLFLLAHADGSGRVDMTPGSIAARGRFPLDVVERALVILTTPDPQSRSPEHGGRRMVLLDPHRSWGWQIVNHGRYRERQETRHGEERRMGRDPEKRRETQRAAMQRWREKRRGEPRVSRESLGEPSESHMRASQNGSTDSRASSEATPKESLGRAANAQKQKQKKQSESKDCTEALQPASMPTPARKTRQRLNPGSGGNAPNASSSERPGEDMGLGSGPALILDPARSLEVAPVGFLLPCVAGPDFPVREVQVEEWKLTYPAVDVGQELREMRAWLIANPRRRKTPRGVLAFIATWLGREQDRGAVRNGYQSPEQHQQQQDEATRRVRVRERERREQLMRDLDGPREPIPAEAREELNRILGEGS